MSTDVYVHVNRNIVRPKRIMGNRTTQRITTIAFAVIALHTQIASGAEAGKAKAKPKTEYIRYIPGADPAAATRAFDAKWKAIFVSTPWPQYPYEARRRRLTGTGVLRIYVDESGKVTGVTIIKSTGHRQLDDAGLKAFGQWRAKPGPRREVDMPLRFLMNQRI
jgi:TonB family protein